MVDMSAVSGTVSALKGALDILKAIMNLRDAKAIQAKIGELNAKLIEAQSHIFAVNDERSALVEQVRKLEEEVARLEAWDADKQRYELADIGAGVLGYVPKAGMEGAEPPHQLCAHCYQDNKKSILQRETRNPGRCRVAVCHRCGSDYYLEGHWRPEHRRR